MADGVRSDVRLVYGGLLKLAEGTDANEGFVKLVCNVARTNIRLWPLRHALSVNRHL